MNRIPNVAEGSAASAAIGAGKTVLRQTVVAVVGVLEPSETFIPGTDILTTPDAGTGNPEPTRLRTKLIWGAETSGHQPEARELGDSSVFEYAEMLGGQVARLLEHTERPGGKRCYEFLEFIQPTDAEAKK